MILKVSCHDASNFRDTKQHINRVMDFLTPFILDNEIYDHYWYTDILTIFIEIDDRIVNRNILLNISLPSYFTYPIFDGRKTTNCSALLEYH